MQPHGTWAVYEVKKHVFVRFEVFTALMLRSLTLQGVMPCSRVNRSESES
jgi:hypothetical protein